MSQQRPKPPTREEVAARKAARSRRQAARTRKIVRRTEHEARPTGGMKPEDPNLPRKELVEPEFYYDKHSLRYLARNHNGEVIPQTEGSIKRRLEELGEDWRKRRGFIGNPLTYIQDNFGVDYYGAVAGHPIGIYTYSGRKILVDTAPPITPATHGGNTLVREYVERLLGPLQSDLFHAWIKLSREALLGQHYDKFLAMVIAGQTDVGKSRLAMLTKLMFNDTFADPYKHMSGGTNFNQDLTGSILLLIDDDGNNPRIESRRNLLNAFKQFTVGAVSRCEGKGTNAVVLDPFWRLLVTINDSPKSLQVLPEMHSTLLDKLIMLKTVGKGVNMPTGTQAERDAFWKPLVAGVGDYLGWLEGWTIPVELVGQRFGLIAWQHEDLKASVQSTSPEVRVLELIDGSGIFVGDEHGRELQRVTGGLMITARELYDFLRNTNVVTGPSAIDAERTIKNPGSLAMFLHELSESHPERVSKSQKRVPGGGPAFWLIKPAAGV